MSKGLGKGTGKGTATETTSFFFDTEVSVLFNKNVQLLFGTKFCIQIGSCAQSLCSFLCMTHLLLF